MTRVAYLTSRFPKLSETFIANEAAAVRRAGIGVRVYAYVEETAPVRHPTAAVLAADACFSDRRRVMADQWFWLRSSPRRYARAWWRAIAGNIKSARFLARALVVVPVSASFARTMLDDKIEHVHAHYATHSALGAYVVHLLTDVPYSFTAHAHDIQVDRTMLQEKVEHAAFVVAISQFNARALIGEGGDPGRVHVVRCGVDTTRFANRNTSTSPPFRIAIVASLERRKGHRILFESVRRLLDGGHEVVVDVVGDGPDAGEIDRDIHRLSLADVVFLAGARSSPDVVRTLRDADAFALPSLTEPNGKMEGIPVALMEAMAVGLPVVATRMSGIPELVIDDVTGLLISEGSVDELTNALRRLIESSDVRERLGTEARHHVRREFDEGRNVDRLVELFSNSPPDGGNHVADPALATHAS